MSWSLDGILTKETREISDEFEDDIEYDEGEDEDKNLDKIVDIDVSNYKPGFKVVQKSFPSLRFDAVICSALNISRK